MMRAETAQKRVTEMARWQYGLVTTAQFHAAGFDRNSIQHLVQTGWLTPVRQHVYRIDAVVPTWRSAALAAVLAAGDGAVVSYYSAGALWDLLDPSDLEGRLEVTASRQVRIKGVTAHRDVLRRQDRSSRFRIPTTTIERTLVDLSRVEAPRTLGRLIDEALRRGLTTVGRIDLALERHRRRGSPSLASVRWAMGQRGASYEPGANDWEQEMDRMWEAMGLPAAPRQYVITLPSGRKVRPDRAIVDARISVDWNGYGHHGRRSDFERDIERRNELIAAGWTPLDFHSHQTPAAICTTVLAVYRRRAA
ncbi:MAG TPA: type IV toxin-antitoxin system AbiEi family antitoxin domain-containing protein [Acidimicrobiales bacterium]|jgi:hypothetical protein|nr:type IV toxin-antitoxin system AbiEi family antitoxin domain-containing protein [Acidimicrobiales bacterium]